MPCSYYTAEESARIEYEEKQKIKAELDKTTRLLCEVLSGMEEWPVDPSPELQDWWKNHKEMDKARKAEEEATAKRVAELKAKNEKMEEELDRKLYNKLKKKHNW